MGLFAPLYRDAPSRGIVSGPGHRFKASVDRPGVAAVSGT
jgi:hypothetical protein